VCQPPSFFPINDRLMKPDVPDNLTEDAPDEPASEPAKNWPESRWGRWLHSLFVIPFFIALFGVILATLVYVVAADDRSINDYLEDIQTGRKSKRWQAAFELSKIFVNPDRVPGDHVFVPQVIALFDDETMRQEDPRVRQYLALAMGRSGIDGFYAPLMEGFHAAGADDRAVFIQALGYLGRTEAVDELHPYLQHAKAPMRLVTVIALGNIGARESIEHLLPLLSDAEPNVMWDAAVALAKLGDRSGREILLALMSREYYAQFGEVDAQERARAMVVAIQAAAGLGDSEMDAAIARLAKDDPNALVSNAARKALEHIGGRRTQ